MQSAVKHGSETSDRGPVSRRAYSPPTLTRYGEVRVLTQSGSGPDVESAKLGARCPNSGYKPNVNC
jgi:hypothetical protein